MNTKGIDENREQAESQLENIQRMGMLLELTEKTEFSDILERHIDERRELADGDALSLEVEKTVKIVLCTGGPHCEIRITEDSDPTIVCYGWFGSDRFERTLTQRERRGLEYIYGDFDDLIRQDVEANMYGDRY